jgi:cell division protein FtsZ
VEQNVTKSGDNNMFELMEDHNEEAIIKVIGVGGGGGNAVEHMVLQTIEGVEFITANTDSQALRNSGANVTLQLGHNVTKGLGAGANPEIGRLSAEEDRETIKEALKGADMVFIAAGMGGGTGTGAAPVVAEIAKEMGILTVAVVTKPFPFEGKKRMNYADQGIEFLSKSVDSLITIPNEKLLKVLGPGTSLLDAFKAANDVLLGAVQGIAELITRPGLINVDFADVRTVMSEMGTAMMGSGTASGPDRAEEAAEAAISSPLLEDVDLAGARGILVNITAGMDISIDEFETVGNAVKAFSSENATVVVGAVIDPEMTDELRVTVVATGIGADRKPDITLVNPTPIAEPQVVGGDYTPSAQPELSSNPVTMPEANAQAQKVTATELDDYLDIPAFLRKQAD